MAIRSTYLGSATTTGEDAKAFMRMMKHGRILTAATASAHNGIKAFSQAV